MNKKGFTLIELLAVIVILAIVSLILVPIVNNLIEDAKERAFLNSAFGIMKTAMYYRSNPTIENKKDEIDLMTNTLDYGGKHYEGRLTFNEENDIRFFIKDENLCAVKAYTDENPRLITGTDCSLADAS